jgi:hypothetical protein
MRLSHQRQALSALALAVAGLVGPGAAAAATTLPASAGATATVKQQHWSAWGGTVGVRWNRELASDLGLTLGAAVNRQAELSPGQNEMFSLRQTGTLEFDVRNNNLYAFTGGALQAVGGYAIAAPGGPIDLTNFTLVPRTGGAPGSVPILDIVSADGKAWFYVDRLMYELIDSKQRLAVRTMDLRVSPELAARLGHPEAAGWAVADLQMTTDVQRQGTETNVLATPKWHGQAVPGVPGAVYQADLFMADMTFQYSRCDLCTGEGGNGRTVFTPSSTLKNNVNNGSAAVTVAGDALGTSSALYAADIPWWQKFSGVNAPYSNDQHPFLIWNLYRFNPDGSIDQIGRSGVKHAFLTLNTACLEDPGNSHILGRGCSDVYGVGNNDSNNSQGPRSEIIPATNQWGRCGSIYDTNCDGIANATPLGVYDQRLVVRESQFSGTGNTGATYLFESWYLAREDVNILNSMATKRATFTRNGSLWAVGGNDQFKLGPAIDRWVDPAAPGPNASNVQVVTAEGRVKVAAKATNLGSNLWRYDYAVMNLDFSRPVTQGAEPNLRVVSNNGFDWFNVPVGNATLTDLKFSDGDLDTTNDWQPALSRSGMIWRPITRSNPNYLNWGTMFRFSFISDRAPETKTVSLHVVGGGNPDSLNFPGTIGPASQPPVAR